MFWKKGSSVGMFNTPWGVAVSDKDEIAVTDSFNKRVQLFDSSGVFLRCFGREGTNQGNFVTLVGYALITMVIFT